MPWGGPALLFVRRSAQIGFLRVGVTDVLSALLNGRVRIVILARDAAPRLRNQIYRDCEGTNTSIFEVPDGQELGNAAILHGRSTPICALVANDTNQDLIGSWEAILYAIWYLHIDLSGYDP